jgi:membrane-anchored glycerophosphoryl diester phosphodiesterase (GDPDase)
MLFKIAPLSLSLIILHPTLFVITVPFIACYPISIFFKYILCPVGYIFYEDNSMVELSQSCSLIALKTVLTYCIYLPNILYECMHE